MSDGAITIRSFRVCFDLERRIHRIDRWRVPMPYGLPVRSVGYWAAALLAILLLGRLPLVGVAVYALPAPLRLVLLPAAAAYALTQLRVDGRPAHSAGLSLLRHRLSARELVAFRPAMRSGEHRLSDVLIAHDEGGARYRRGILHGPGRATLRYPATARRSRAALRVEQTGERPMWRGKRVALRAGQRLELR